MFLKENILLCLFLCSATYFSSSCNQKNDLYTHRDEQVSQMPIEIVLEESNSIDNFLYTTRLKPTFTQKKLEELQIIMTMLKIFIEEQCAKIKTMVGRIYSNILSKKHVI